MTGNADTLEAVIRHATQVEDDYDDIAPMVTALAASGDTSLVPRLEGALTRFLDEANFYGRDLIAGILAGVRGTAALPALLHAAARDLGDDQDALQTEIIDLLRVDPVAALPTVRQFANAEDPAHRRVGLWARAFLDDCQEDDTTPDARPVVAINDRGLWLGVDQAGTWLVWSDSQPPVPAGDRLVWLLPLLERAPDDVVAVLGVDPAETPLPALVRFALTCWSDYWRGLALGWLESTWPATDLLDVLAELKDDRAVAQPLRHRALRVWLTARPR